jgi:hypothetical protein
MLQAANARCKRSTTLPLACDVRSASPNAAAYDKQYEKTKSFLHLKMSSRIVADKKTVSLLPEYLQNGSR